MKKIFEKPRLEVVGLAQVQAVAQFGLPFDEFTEIGDGGTFNFITSYARDSGFLMPEV